jgi:hypothetical protein
LCFGLFFGSSSSSSTYILQQPLLTPPKKPQQPSQKPPPMATKSTKTQRPPSVQPLTVAELRRSPNEVFCRKVSDYTYVLVLPTIRAACGYCGVGAVVKHQGTYLLNPKVQQKVSCNNFRISELPNFFPF